MNYFGAISLECDLKVHCSTLFRSDKNALKREFVHDDSAQARLFIPVGYNSSDTTVFGYGRNSMKIIERLTATLYTVAVVTCVVFAMIAAVPTASFAQASSIPSTRQVIVGGTLFLTVRTSWGGLTPEQRAAQVQERINHALSIGPIHASDIGVAKVDGDWIVLLQGKRLFTADYAAAKMDQVRPELLAQQWASFLKTTLPGLTKPTSGMGAKMGATTSPDMPPPAAATTAPATN
jgi:preprotein translocase subunit SecG